MTYFRGKAWCEARGLHYWLIGESTCRKCGTQRTRAEVEDAADIVDAWRDQYSDGEWDVRSHERET